MKSILIIAAAVNGAFAQYLVNSQPFRLFLKSDNETINGQSLGACHQGAAIEGLCPSGLTHADQPTSYDTFYQQTEADPDFTLPDNDPYGYLVWNLTVNGGMIIPSYMQLNPSLLSNVANPTILPGNESATTVAFASSGCMYFPMYMDDTVTPPVTLEEAWKIESWYTCLTRYSYLYVTLSWVNGLHAIPENPTCQKVQVIREFI